ncbi:MAG TPA: hypothetical protein VJK51_03030 [Candidatus Nanoarchaeia archaeon]|nr:hypothetical protein [Candidatus Nanoarchaeia archaeon]
MNNASTSSAIAPLLVLIGLIIGLLNVTDTEVMPFLWSSVALIIATSLGSGAFGDIVIADGILQALLLVFVPATVIVAIKNVFAIAKH